MTRDEIILSLQPKVKKTAERFCRRLSSQDRDVIGADIEQAAWIGAIRAVDSYSPTRGPLSTYADWRIRGEILDFLRGEDHLPRLFRMLLKRVDEEVPDCWRRPYTLDRMNFRYGDRWDRRPHPPLSERIQDTKAMQPFAQLEMSQHIARMLQASLLSDRLRRVVHERYWDDKPLKAIGEGLGVNESRACQLLHDALRLLAAQGAA